MTRRKTETAASLRGIRAQLRKEINRAEAGVYLVGITVRQAKRIEEALKQFERFERILTEPEQ